MPCIRPVFRCAQWSWLAGLWLFCNTAAADIGLDAQQRVWQWQGNNLPQRMAAIPRATKAVNLDGRYFVLDDTGQLWAWGSNNAGQLGLAHFKASDTPQKVPLNVRITDVAAGKNHTLAIDETGQIWAWGANNRGQLGLEAASPLSVQTRPAHLVAPFRAIRVATGPGLSLAQDDKHQIWQWGDADSGALSPPKVTKKVAWPDPTDTRVRLISGKVSPKSGKSTVQAEILVNGKPCATPAADGRYSCAVPASLKGALTARADGLRFNGSIKLPVERDLDKADFIADSMANPTVEPARPESNKPPAPAKSPLANANPAPVGNSAPAMPAVSAPRKSTVTLSGWVRTGTGASSGQSGVQIQGKGANCAPTDDTGRFSCQVPAGWSGSLTVTKPGYRFAPSTVSLSAIYDDDPEVQNFRAYFEPR